MSCLGLQVVLDYKFGLLSTIAIWGAFFASSDFLVGSVEILFLLFRCYLLHEDATRPITLAM